jgi:hypothetical protein
MAGITLEQAQARLTQYLAAEEAVLAGQRYRLGDREMTRADLSAIQQGIVIWNARCERLTRSGITVREVIPR